MPALRIGLLSLMVALAAVALLAARPSHAQGVSAPCQSAAPAGESKITLESGGVERTAILYVPPAPAGQRLPLLVALRGAGGALFEPYSGFSVVADAEGFIALYPDPIEEYEGHTFWNLDPNAGPNDVQFVAALLEYVESELCVDTSRVYAAGVSNGGSMATLLACELSSRFAAFASIAGGYSALPPCEPTNPVSVIEVHGTADTVVPYNGFPPDGTGAVRPWLAEWRARDGCTSAQSVSRIAPRVERYEWSDCVQGTAVEHIEIFGGGHQLPGALPPDPGQTGTVSASWLVWDFLSRFSAGSR